MRTGLNILLITTDQERFPLSFTDDVRLAHRQRLNLTDSLITSSTEIPTEAFGKALTTIPRRPPTQSLGC